MKKNDKQGYLKRASSTLKSKLNSRNTFQAINAWVVPTICYGAGIVKWTKEELRHLDRKTRKTISMHGGLNPRSNVQRLYIPEMKVEDYQ